jgi:hypothetical protein
MVILSHDAGASGRYFFTGSSVLSFPRSSRRKIEAAVNCFVIEAMLNRVVEEFGTFHSKSAIP